MTNPVLDAKALESHLRAGESLDEIAAVFGVSRSTVWRRRKEFGLGYIRHDDLRPHDSPEQIRACLNCARSSCSGTCKLIKKLAH